MVPWLRNQGMLWAEAPGHRRPGGRSAPAACREIGLPDLAEIQLCMKMAKDLEVSLEEGHARFGATDRVFCVAIAIWFLACTLREIAATAICGLAMMAKQILRWSSERAPTRMIFLAPGAGLVSAPGPQSSTAGLLGLLFQRLPGRFPSVGTGSGRGRVAGQAPSFPCHAAGPHFPYTSPGDLTALAAQARGSGPTSASHGTAGPIPADSDQLHGPDHQVDTHPDDQVEILASSGATTKPRQDHAPRPKF